MKEKEKLITRDLLDELYTIDPVAGTIFNKKARQKVTVGKEAGTIDGKGYYVLMINGKRYLRSRIMFFYANNRWPECVDHRDGVRTNDAISNLREVTHQQNHQNRTTAKGYYWHKKAGKWMVRCMVGEKSHYLGLYECEELARYVYLVFRIANSTIDLAVHKHELEKLAVTLTEKGLL